VPLVGKAHGYTVVVEGPHLFDESVVELLVPLARQKRFDRLADGLPRRLRSGRDRFTEKTWQADLLARTHRVRQGEVMANDSSGSSDCIVVTLAPGRGA
jgi:hypothetical protein